MTILDSYIQQDKSISLKNLNRFTSIPNDESAKEFIQNYFNSRQKSLLFNIFFTDRESMYSKSVHTVSAFLLGMSLREIVQKRIKELIRENTSYESLVSFEYPWFLSCLYHDVFSENEEKHDTTTLPAKLKDAICWLDVRHTIYNPSLPDGIIISPILTTYHHDTIEAYYAYRYNRMTIDHGILSGLICFDKLVENYLINRKKNDNKKQFFTDPLNNGHILDWHEEQLWVFGLAADAIITHNIWHQGPEEKLPGEITKDDLTERKLSLIDTPLAFFLSLIDTIEPVKFFNGILPKKIMENISIEWNGESHKIIIQQSDLNIFDFEKWYNIKMKDMKDWLLVKSSKYLDGIIDITLY